MWWDKLKSRGFCVQMKYPFEEFFFDDFLKILEGRRLSG